jgi:hypothetical protein
MIRLESLRENRAFVTKKPIKANLMSKHLALLRQVSAFAVTGSKDARRNPASILLIGIILAFGPAMSVAQESAVVAAVAQQAATRERFRSVDKDVQDLKKDMLDLNRDLLQLEQELLFPADTQTTFFVALDVGEYFTLDSVNLKIDGKEVASYVYKAREINALQRGGVHRLHMTNLKAGDHELTAEFIGRGPNTRDYRRDTTLTFNKDIDARNLTLEITDRMHIQQPELVIRNWE